LAALSFFFFFLRLRPAEKAAESAVFMRESTKTQNDQISKFSILNEQKYYW
jgi:hypothetical protein